jgi:hypothetical protein
MDLGPPDRPLFNELPFSERFVGTRRVNAGPVAEAILAEDAEAVAADPASKAFWEISPLSGKTVRIAYADGVTVESIEPVNCDLTVPECYFLLRMPVLRDGHVVSENLVAPAGTWSVNSARLAHLIGPWTPPIPRGEVTFRRNQDYRRRGKQYATLHIRSSCPKRAAGRKHLPEGTIEYNVSDGEVEAVRLVWRGKVDRLFPPYFQMNPNAKCAKLRTEPCMTFCCFQKIRSPAITHASHGRQMPAADQGYRGLGPAEEGQDGDRPQLATVLSGHREKASRGVAGDLIVALLVVFASSVAAFWCGTRIAGNLSSRASSCIALATLVLLLVFAATAHGKLWLAQVLPFSNVVVLGNWIPLGASFLGGLAGGQRAIPLWRRSALAVILISLGSYTVLDDFLVPPSPSRSYFDKGTCIQTTRVSCSPCCAVTLLDCCGIESSEGEMMDLCVTSRFGTPMLGLYRGLKLKTRNTDWDVEAFRCSVPRLRQEATWPVILRIRLSNAPPAGIPVERRSRWRAPRMEHTIVVFGFRSDGRVLIGDSSNPKCSSTCWSVDELRKCWGGEGLRLVRRRRR